MIAATAPRRHDLLRLVALPSRPLRADELRVATRTVGVNPVDWKMRELGSPLGLGQRLLAPSGPQVVGIDFAGEVTDGGRARDPRPRRGEDRGSNAERRSSIAERPSSAR